MRRPLMAGNWKMHKDNAAARELAQAIVAKVGDMDGADVVLCPPFTALTVVAEVIRDSNIALGAQDIFWAAEGAYTGEVSGPMLASAGCEYVIVGHSERRCRFGTWPQDWPEELMSVFGDNDVTVNWKTRAALAADLTPIICVGETIDERRAGATDTVVREQVSAALAGLSDEEITGVVFAYEPVWAIGTGEVCDADEANRVIGLIRTLLHERVGAAADEMQILYGGSVKPDNIEGLMEQPEIDGGLVGGASLSADSFAALVEAAARIRGK
ncbi:MAG: triose-phosphate isomerase [Armatimonadetes bacterium]|nr:triose-phosphate isomerase [Armatimonadota bacterium]